MFYVLLHSLPFLQFIHTPGLLDVDCLITVFLIIIFVVDGLAQFASVPLWILYNKASVMASTQCTYRKKIDLTFNLS